MRASTSQLLATSALLLVCLTAASPAFAVASKNVLIVGDGAGGLTTDITTHLQNLENSAGNTPSIVTGVPGSGLSSYGQIWDLRFENSTPITTGERSQYLGYLQGGGAMFVMGENQGFNTRNISVDALIAAAGGGTVTLTAANNSQTVLGAATGPNSIPGNAITFLAASGATSFGSGTCLAHDASSRCSAIAYGVGSLTNAPTGSLVTVYDVNFMQASASSDNQLFLRNLVQFVTVQANGGAGGAFSTFADTPYQKAVAGSFDKLFASADGNLSKLMVGVAGLSSDAERQQALERIGLSFPQVPVATVFRSVRANYDDVMRWMNAPTANGPANVADATAPFQVALNDAGTSGVMSDVNQLAIAGTGDSSQPFWTNSQGLNAYLNVGYLGGSQNATQNQTGYVYNGFAGTAGLAYDINTEFTAGVAAGWTHTTADVGDNRASADTDLYNFMGYGHYHNAMGFYGDALANVAAVKFNYQRTIAVGGVSLEADGDTGGIQAGGSVGGGYDFQLQDAHTGGLMHDVAAGPLTRVQYQHLTLNKYTETGAGNASLAVDDQDANSLTWRVGGRAVGAFDTAWGTFRPSLTLAYEREFLDHSYSVTTAFTGGGAAPFAIPVDAGNRDFGIVGAGISREVGKNMTLGLLYEGRLNPEEQQHAVAVRLNIAF